MSWKFENHIVRYDSPATKAVAISPSNTTELAEPVRALYVGGDGDVKVTPVESDTPVIFVGVVAGTIIPIVTRQVWAADTSATSIVGLL